MKENKPGPGILGGFSFLGPIRWQSGGNFAICSNARIAK
jgi:hypothetical protein